MEELDKLKIVWWSAYDMVDKYFKDKVDRGGHPYKNHLLYVSDHIDVDKFQHCEKFDLPYKEFYLKCEIAGLLHDIFEDTDCTEEEIRSIGCDDEIVEALKALTKQDSEDYFDFIKRVKANEIAKVVKIYDIENNMDIRRLKKVTDKDLQRIKKYFWCWKFLKDEVDEEKVLKMI